MERYILEVIANYLRKPEYGKYLENNDLEEFVTNLPMKELPPFGTFFVDELKFMSIDELLSKISFIPKNFFMGCNETSIQIFNNIKRMASNAFSFCDNLFDALLLCDCDIPSQCFQCCDKLHKVVIRGGTDTIWTEAFAACHNLEEIYLSKSVNYIDRSAFFKCPKNLKIKTHNPNLRYNGDVGEIIYV